jgi:putative SOS response-associated peptidase YedK
MCARLAIHTTPDELAQIFDLKLIPQIIARYNVAPSQILPVIGLKADGIQRGLIPMTWGFVPHWAETPDQGPKPINARSETVLQSGAFRESFRQRRCLIPVSGFYEWQTVAKKKLPHYFAPVEGPVFALAGLWDRWMNDHGPDLLTCCILTTTANPVLAPYHDRMPVIIPPADWKTWLSRTTRTEDAHQLCRPYQPDLMREWPVTPKMNKPTYDTPDCISPLTT